jgi:hypothetical protein
MKDAQATEEAFSPQKRTSSTSKHENSVLFSILDPDPDPQEGRRWSDLTVSTFWLMQTDLLLFLFVTGWRRRR